MSQLTEYFSNHLAKAVRMSLGEWIESNPLPAICDVKIDGDPHKILDKAPSKRVFLFKSKATIVLATSLTLESSTGWRYKKMFERLVPQIKAEKIILDCEYSHDTKKIWVLDILDLNGEDVSQRPLLDRRNLLKPLISETEYFRIVQYNMASSFEEIQKIKEEAIAQGWEGLIVKNPSSTYGQKNAWLKMKKFDTADVFVTGFVPTKEFEISGVYHSWSCSAFDENGKAVELGDVGSIKADAEKAMEIRKAIKLGSVLEIQYEELTGAGRIRHPFILRLRDDKEAKDCTTEQLKQVD